MGVGGGGQRDGRRDRRRTIAHERVKQPVQQYFGLAPDRMDGAARKINKARNAFTQIYCSSMSLFIYSLFSVRIVTDVVYSSLLALTQGQLPNTVNCVWLLPTTHLIRSIADAFGQLSCGGGLRLSHSS